MSKENLQVDDRSVAYLEQLEKFTIFGFFFKGGDV